MAAPDEIERDIRVNIEYLNSADPKIQDIGHAFFARYISHCSDVPDLSLNRKLISSTIIPEVAVYLTSVDTMSGPLPRAGFALIQMLAERRFVEFSYDFAHVKRKAMVAPYTEFMPNTDFGSSCFADLQKSMSSDSSAEEAMLALQSAGSLFSRIVHMRHHSSIVSFTQCCNRMAEDILAVSVETAKEIVHCLTWMINGLVKARWWLAINTLYIYEARLRQILDIAGGPDFFVLDDNVQIDMRKCVFELGCASRALPRDLHNMPARNQGIVRSTVSTMCLFLDVDRAVFRTSPYLAFTVMDACTYFTHARNMEIIHAGLAGSVRHTDVSQNLFDLEMQDLFVQHVKNLPDNEIWDLFTRVISKFNSGGFLQRATCDILRSDPVIYGSPNRCETSEWRRRHPGQPFAHTWGTNPRHHIDFVLLALKRRSTELLELMHQVLGRLGPVPEIEDYRTSVIMNGSPFSYAYLRITDSGFFR